jgi:hypothetical protein
MKRMWMNYLLDVLLFLTAMVLGISSLLVWVVLPKGYNPQWLLWIAIHKWSGFALFVGTFLHIVSHWKWLVATTRKVFRKK